MSRAQLTTGIAVVAALVVVAIFFIFQNPLAVMQNPGAAAAAAQNSDSGAGLVVQDEVVGTGAEAKSGMQVTVNYTGKLQNGAVFDSSIGRAPITFVLGSGQVIPGWEQGLVGMKVGGKRLLIIPPSLGYGAQTVGPIPGNSTLVFEVDLVSAQVAPSGAPSAPKGSSAQ
jgi:FKBP-type peptidyl-prolyl cis-trans isomerase